jgi:hypothetical protein
MQPSWNELFFEGSLPEKRLRERAIEIAEAMTERPGAPMNAAFDNANDVRAAYDFFKNKHMTLPVLLDPAIRTVMFGLRELGSDATVLCVQDTTELNHSHRHAMTGLGTLGNPKNRGEFLHPALAVSTEGVPLGLLNAMTWIRPVEQLGKAQQRKDRAFEDKESVRWWVTIDEVERMLQRPGLLLHVTDREGDIFELFHRAQKEQKRLLIRASQDRCVEGEHRLLWAQAESFPVCEQQRTIQVPERPATKDKPKRPARPATLALRSGQVTLQAPRGCKGSVQAWAILVRELEAPPGEEPIEWLLLTFDPITSFDEAWRHVDWYRYRWVIEEFFKVLKTGLKVEKRQFDDLKTFEVSLGMSLLVGVRLLALTKQARIDPEQPASTALSPDEQQVLIEHAQVKRGRPSSSPLTMLEAVILIAKLGGYLGRSCDGPPGWLTLWRGYSRLCAMVEGYRLAQRKESDTSRPKGNLGNSASSKAKA